MRDARNCFFGYMNMGFAMGTSHMQYWSWKDGAKTLFPWGLRYTGDNVAREQLYWMRNHNLFTRQMEPKDETAKVAVLLPDNTRLSGASYGYAGNTAGVSCIDILQSAHVGAITTLSERALEGSASIPSGIQAIFYPAAYNPSDAVYNKIKTFVERRRAVSVGRYFLRRQLSAYQGEPPAVSCRRVLGHGALRRPELAPRHECRAVL